MKNELDECLYTFDNICQVTIKCLPGCTLTTYFYKKQYPNLNLNLHPQTKTTKKGTSDRTIPQ